MSAYTTLVVTLIALATATATLYLGLGDEATPFYLNNLNLFLGPVVLIVTGLSFRRLSGLRGRLPVEDTTKHWAQIRYRYRRVWLVVRSAEVLVFALLFILAAQHHYVSATCWTLTLIYMITARRWIVPPPAVDTKTIKEEQDRRAAKKAKREAK